MMQPRITGSIVRGLFHPPLITRMTGGRKLERDGGEGKVETCPPLLSGDPGSSLRAEREAERTFKASQNDIGEQGHDGRADKARDGHSDKPSHEDVSKQPPVHCLLGAQPANRHH